MKIYCSNGTHLDLSFSTDSVDASLFMAMHSAVFIFSDILHNKEKMQHARQMDIQR